MIVGLFGCWYSRMLMLLLGAGRGGKEWLGGWCWLGDDGDDDDGEIDGYAWFFGLVERTEDGRGIVGVVGEYVLYKKDKKRLQL